MLTKAGRDLVPVVLGLFDGGNKRVLPRARLRAVHHDCGADVRVGPRCGP